MYRNSRIPTINQQWVITASQTSKPLTIPHRSASLYEDAIYGCLIVVTRSFVSDNGTFTGTADEQSEAIDHYIGAMKKGNKTGKVMFPNWPCTTQLAADEQVNVLSAPFMGLIWNCVLYHAYIDDKMRVHSTNVQQILRLICIAVQAMTEQRFTTDIKAKLIENFVQSFAFRLTNEWDYIEDSNKESIVKKYGEKTNQTQSQTNKNDNDTEMKSTAADGEDEYHAKAVQQYDEMMRADGAGVGSSLWLLCKMIVDSRLAPPKVTHIDASQLLVIEQILIKLHAMNIDALHSVMTPLWSPPSNDDTTLPKKKKKKKKLSAAEKRKRKAARAREKAMKKMQQNKA
eukprot:769717_1